MPLRRGGASSRFIAALWSTPDPNRLLQEQVAILVADVHDLALYTKLNFTGFIKIVKAGGSLEA
jgi:SPX domain protein involved in polyphosphate accumulation